MPEDAEPTRRSGPVLAVFAHPDDAEICAGGAMAKWAATGREVHLLILTNGDRGSGDPTASRKCRASLSEGLVRSDLTDALNDPDRAALLAKDGKEGADDVRLHIPLVPSRD